jgi:hypothetical protein
MLDEEPSLTVGLVPRSTSRVATHNYSTTSIFRHLLNDQTDLRFNNQWTTNKSRVASIAWPG